MVNTTLTLTIVVILAVVTPLVITVVVQDVDVHRKKKLTIVVGNVRFTIVEQELPHQYKVLVKVIL
jgi:hypothetical protein